MPLALLNGMTAVLNGITLCDTLLAELDLEAPFIRRMLERVPLEKSDWKPHDKSMTLGWLATFLSVMWTWGVFAIEQDAFDPSKVPGAGQKPRTPKTTEELIHQFDENVATFRRSLAGIDDTHLMKRWKLMMDGQLFFERPRWLVLQTYILNHAVHHRAQLGVYLRLLGIPVPAIYNDSADEKGGMFR